MVGSLGFSGSILCLMFWIGVRLAVPYLFMLWVGLFLLILALCLVGDNLFFLFWNLLYLWIPMCEIM